MVVVAAVAMVGRKYSRPGLVQFDKEPQECTRPYLVYCIILMEVTCSISLSICLSSS